MIIIGIDPGKSGAVAVINSVDNTVFLADTPTFKSGAGSRTEYNVSAMVDMLTEWRSPATHVAIEQVHSMPGQGVASTFSFGMGYGLWVGIVAALGYSHSFVRPNIWKRDLGLSGSQKDDARIAAQQLFPVVRLPAKKDVGRADALLIAEWCRRKIQNK